MSRFFETSANESFSERLVLIKSGARCPVRRRFRNDFTLLLGNVDTIARLLRCVGRGGLTTKRSDGVRVTRELIGISDGSQTLATPFKDRRVR